MNEEKTDGDLVAEFKRGAAAQKEKAFAELLRRHREPIYQVCRRLLNSSDDADDVAQTTFLKIFRALPNFQEEAEFSTWAYRIAVNESLNFLKAQKLRAALSLDALESDVKSDGERPDERIERDETRQAIEDAIAALPEKQRAVFVMRYYDELSYEEIANIVGGSVGGLKANYFHAFKKVQEFLKRRLKQER
ncbi:MAG: RNA polymerase sigma factor [Chloroherpetonaceae bacterium]|nr:RNA polymerase sigma factor [Chloroherpetonaceae bacterium]MDW8436984.1 RNA polymerase sigma factor [Chloroherpetonaceae bacterium]